MNLPKARKLYQEGKIDYPQLLDVFLLKAPRSESERFFFANENEKVKIVTGIENEYEKDFDLIDEFLEYN
ncbi:hypothetical protein GO491_11715 [Flavobacteriaceae bacterium Ap0902]|nr:hypothetical protein [Flavobacteriaceae bacterium Ap0902]